MIIFFNLFQTLWSINPYIRINMFAPQASRWCEKGIFLLASQPVDRCQSQDGAEAALQELERYLDTATLHTVADRGAICCQYEAVLTAQLRVSRKWTPQIK